MREYPKQYRKNMTDGQKQKNERLSKKIERE